MRSLAGDLRFGLLSEEAHKPALEGHLKTKLERSTARFCPFDYQNEDWIVELKTRTNKRNAFKTTILPQKKLDKLLNDKRRKFLAFCFTDGLFGVEVTDDILCKLEQNKSGGRFDRGVTEWQDHGYCHVAVGLLKRLSSSASFFETSPSL